MHTRARVSGDLRIIIIIIIETICVYTAGICMQSVPRAIGLLPGRFIFRIEVLLRLAVDLCTNRKVWWVVFVSLYFIIIGEQTHRAVLVIRILTQLTRTPLQQYRAYTRIYVYRRTGAWIHDRKRFLIFYKHDFFFF